MVWVFDSGIYRGSFKAFLKGSIRVKGLGIQGLGCSGERVLGFRVSGLRFRV